ncbi:MAG TPA: nucleotide pyrophosphohydrolase [Candidatus Saccharimonadales bacterium]|nr:nucleotide pyrophosphohydrolase [Candidatus Saccharimonadales bacterium]
MSRKDNETTVQELIDIAAEFRRERGWDKHNTPRNLATSIIVEAAELLEHFQWGDYSEQNKQEIADELADVLAYCFGLAYTLDIDVATVYRDKIERAKKKFPVELFNPEQDNKEAYKRIKTEYRQKPKGSK